MIESLLKSRNREDSCLVLAAAQLRPEYQSDSDILDFLVRLCLHVSSENTAMKMGDGDLARVLKAFPNNFPDIARNRDPLEDLFDSELSTDKVNGTLLNGTHIGHWFEGQLLLGAIAELADEYPEFARYQALIQFALLLSDVIVSRVRKVFEMGVAGDDLQSKLVDCLIFSPAHYHELLGAAGCDNHVSELLEHSLAGQHLAPFELGLDGLALRIVPIYRREDSSRLVLRPTYLYPAARAILWLNSDQSLRSLLSVAYMDLAATAFQHQLGPGLGQPMLFSCKDTGIRFLYVQSDPSEAVGVFLIPDLTFRHTWPVAGNTPSRLLMNVLAHTDAAGLEMPGLLIFAEVGHDANSPIFRLDEFEGAQVSMTAEELSVILSTVKGDIGSILAFANECEELNLARLSPHYTLDLFRMFWKSGTLRDRLAFNWESLDYVAVVPGDGLELRKRLRPKISKFLRHPQSGLVLRAEEWLPDLAFVRASGITSKTACGKSVGLSEMFIWSDNAKLWLSFLLPRGDLRAAWDTYETLCNAILYWLSQIFGKPPKTQSILRLELELAEQGAWGVLPIPESTRPTITVVPHKSEDYSSLRVRIEPQFQQTIQLSDGTADRVLMSNLLQGLRSLVDFDASAALSRLHSLIDEEKHQFLVGWSSVDPRLDNRELADTVPVTTYAKSRILVELGGVFKRRGVSSKSIRNDPKATLNEAVQLMFAWLESEVKENNSDEAMFQVLAVHERHLCDGHQIELRLPVKYAGRDEDELMEEKSLASEATLASRYLLEIMCALPVNPNASALSERTLQRLLGLCSLLAQFGMSSTIQHSGLGKVDVELLQSGILKLGGVSEQLDQHRRRLLVSSETAQIVQNKFGKYFDHIDHLFGQEYGVELVRLAEVSELLSRHANAGVGNLSTEEFKRVLNSELCIESSVAEKILECWCIPPRESIEGVKKPFSRSDTLPWRFNRALSLLTRPIIRRGEQLFWGVRSAQISPIFISKMVFDGRFKARTNGLKNLMTTIFNERGELFNMQVYSTLEDLGTYVVRKGVKKIGGQKLMNAKNQELGDIDVLCISPETKVIWVLECKSILMSRTPIELAGEMDKVFRGEKNYLKKADNRTNWLRRNLNLVLKAFSLGGHPAQWKVRRRIVTELPSGAALLTSDRKVVVSLDELLVELKMRTP